MPPVGLRSASRAYRPKPDRWQTSLVFLLNRHLAPPWATTQLPAKTTLRWSGKDLLIWGGNNNSGNLGNGARYNLASNTWSALATGNAPAARQLHTAVWTGAEMIIWGGDNNPTFYADGARYNPASDTWISILSNLPNTPLARDNHTAIWTGSEMIIWGGLNNTSGNLLNDGGRYNPVVNSWVAMTGSLPNTPAARYQHTAVWNGSQMIIWGGMGSISRLGDGGRFNPSLNTWAYLPNSVTSTPPPRAAHSAIWTGSELIVWGGTGANSYLNDGGRFNPGLNNWTYLLNNLANTPQARASHAAVWSGNEMIVWGGVNGLGCLNDGGRFNPALNSWIALPGNQANAPLARQHHTAVWTTNEMIVWGGGSNSKMYADGGRFNPLLNTWTTIPRSLANTPGPRQNHTAIWTGSEMIVWGGGTNSGCVADGGRYNPTLNSWTYLSPSLAGSPAGRENHTALWTGTEMIVWGGLSGSTLYGDGGRYNPALNTWTYEPIILTNTPSARQLHTAVWTGNGMIVLAGSAIITMTTPLSLPRVANYFFTNGHDNKSDATFSLRGWWQSE